ncbi:T9SS type A sorting domain-containing protein [Flavobacterium sp. CS20]|uniref:T9SS type A sorting domain-containing protein n=1 Tax=Flavobacterium sp. CS20 TaxID=2775246 RepID=UPI001B39FF3F|nr:T9SS type A sorting domain-containing protein [Flavobacterium sp. CS20]QTY27815.1 T9SS type A sorting domain-containing protein [Flavobacterium sp. CS20]
MNNTIHNNFFNELQNLNSNNGYPNQNGIRNIAISNGSECGTPLNFNPGDPLFDLDYNKDLSFWGDLLSMIYNPLGGTIGGLFLDQDFFGVALLGLVPGSSQYIVDFEAKSLKKSFLGANHQIYNGLIRYKKKIYWIFNSQVTITSVNVNQPSLANLPLDYYGGGFFETGNAVDLSFLPSDLNIFIEDNFSFVPTASALDIGGGSVTLYDTDYKDSYVGAIPPTGLKASPFDNFTTAFSNPNTNNNERHLEFNKRNGDWLAKEIIGANIDFTDCSYLCSGNIEGSNRVCTTNNFTITGQTNSVSWTIEPSNAGTININQTNPNSISLVRNTNFFGSAVLKAVVTTQNCGSGEITKNLEFGAPTTTQSVSLNGPNNLNPGQTGIYSYNTTYFNNATSYDWLFFSNTFPNADQHFELNIISNSTFTVKPDFDVPGGYYTVQARIINTCGFYSLSKTIYVEEGDGTPVLYKNSNIYRIYPNPSSSYFNVSLINENQTPTSSKGIFGEILDLNGLFLRKIEMVNNKAQVDIIDLKKGIYILRIHYDGKTEGHQVIVE